MSDNFDHWDDGMAEKAIEDANKNEPLTIFEKMLVHTGFDVEEWNNLSLKDKANYKWNFNKFGRKE